MKELKENVEALIQEYEERCHNTANTLIPPLARKIQGIERHGGNKETLVYARKLRTILSLECQSYREVIGDLKRVLRNSLSPEE